MSITDNTVPAAYQATDFKFADFALGGPAPLDQ